MMTFFPLYFSEIPLYIQKGMATIEKCSNKFEFFFWWLLRYMSSPGQMLAFQHQLLKKTGQAIVQSAMKVTIGKYI